MMAVVKRRFEITNCAYISSQNRDTNYRNAQLKVSVSPSTFDVLESSYFTWDYTPIQNNDLENVYMHIFREGSDATRTLTYVASCDSVDLNTITWNNKPSRYNQWSQAESTSVGWVRQSIWLQSFNTLYPNFKPVNIATFRLEHKSPSGYSTTYTSTRGTNKPYLEVQYRVADPTCSNLIIESTNRDNPIRINWQGINFNKSNIEVWQNNTRIKNYTQNSSDNSFTIPAGDIKNLVNTIIKVKVAYSPPNSLGDAESVWIERSFTPTCNKPTATSLTVIGSTNDENISISWASENQTMAEVEVWQGPTKLAAYTTTNKNYTIPNNVIKNIGSTVFKIRAIYQPSWSGGGSYLQYSNWVERIVDIKPIVPVVSNLSVTGSTNDTNLDVSWICDNQYSAIIELWQGTSKLKTYTTTSKRYTIPNADVKSPGSYSVQIKTSYKPSWDSSASYLSYSAISIKNLTITAIIPKITSLNVTGNSKDKDIVLDWRQENQKRFIVTLLQNNNPIFTQTVDSTANTFTIPKGTIINTGYVVFIVRPVYFPSWDSSKQYPSNGTDAEKGIQIVETLPILSNITLSGSDRDYPITVGWQSENQSTYELEVWQGGTRKLNYSGATDKQYTIPLGSIPSTGSTEFKVRLSFIPSSGDIKCSEWQSVTTNIVQTEPYIGVISPDGQICDRDSIISVKWTSTNQSTWSVQIHQDGILTHEDSGTIEKETTVPMGKLRTGNAKVTLKVGFIPSSGDTRYAQKSGEFIVQGKPPIPTITSTNTFSVSRPTITWNGQEQMGYILNVLKDGNAVYNTDWENGLITTHKISDYLENGNYTIRIKIKNEYNIESEWSTQNIGINSNAQGSITLGIESITNGVKLSWDNANLTFDKFYIVRNGIPIKLISDVLYNYSYEDYTCNGNVTYWIMGINKLDNYIRSNVVSTKVSVRYPMIATIDKPSDTVMIGIRDTRESGMDTSFKIGSTNVLLSGRSKPVTIFSEHEEVSHTFDFVLLDVSDIDRVKDMCRRRVPFIYRDRNETFFVTIPGFSNNKTLYGKYSIMCTECDYSEVVGFE